MTVSSASRLFSVPRQTLKDRISKRFDSTKCGRKTALSEAEEEALVGYIQYMVSIAQPTIPAIKMFAWAISKRSGEESVFNKEIRPGHNWWWAFRKHHAQNITLRKPDNLDRGRFEDGQCQLHE